MENIIENSNEKPELTLPIQQGIPKSLIISTKVEIEHLLCPICLNILWKPIACAQNKCYSSFCESCITKWIQTDLDSPEISLNQSQSHNQNQQYFPMHLSSTQPTSASLRSLSWNPLDQQQQRIQLIASQQQHQQRFSQNFQQINNNNSLNQQNFLQNQEEFLSTIENSNQRPPQFLQQNEQNEIVQDRDSYELMYNNNNYSFNEEFEEDEQILENQHFRSNQHNNSPSSNKSCPKCKRVFKRTNVPLFNTLLSTLVLHCVYKEQGCEEQVNYDSYEKHLQNCKYRPILCEGCKQNFLQFQYNQHIEECDKYIVECVKCNTEFERIELQNNHNQVQCLQMQNDKKDLKIQELQKNCSDVNDRLNKVERFLSKIIRGETEEITNYEFQTVFNQNFQFSQKDAKLVNSSWNQSKQKYDFLHFYIAKGIKTQGLLPTKLKIKLQRLQGSLLLGICSTLCSHSVDIILNKYGEVKKKESNDNKYKAIRKVNFSFTEGDTIAFTYYPIKQNLKIQNERNNCVCHFEETEINEIGDTFYCFFSMDSTNDHLKFL